MSGGGITFDLSISAGNILTLLAACGTLILAWGRLGSRLDLLEFRVVAIEKTLSDIAAILKQFNNSATDIALLKQEQAAQAQQLATMAETIERMRRGEGYIVERRANIDGEYSRVHYERRGD